MMELIQVMEFITIIVTLLMFMTGIAPCLHMWRTKDTTNVPFFMFLLGAVSCEGMLHYGILLSNSTLVLINLVGTFLQCFYVCLYLVVVSPKGSAYMMLTGAVAYTLAFYVYLFRVVKDDKVITDLLGSSSSTITTILVCYPIVEIIQNIRQKNSDGIPMIMLLGSLACSCCWLVFGLMLNDPNIYSPNIPGIAIVLVKLFVVQLYPPSKSKTA